MNIESGFIDKETSDAADTINESLADFHPLYSSQTGFFRILVGKHWGRKVVIKTIKEEFAHNNVAVAQLKKEFSILFILSSLNVVHAHSLIEIDGQIPAFEMDWCDGTNVREIISNDMTPEDAIEITRGVLYGLKDIHESGVIHRDIKPENVMYDPFRKIVKIIDFGCAYLTGALTLQGPNGTIGYTPEDKMEIGSEPEPKDDLYALGILAEEMAGSLNVQSNKNRQIKKKLRIFSKRLIAGKYLSDDKAIKDFERLFTDTGGHRKIIVASITVGLLAIFIILWLFLNPNTSEPEPTQDISFAKMITDSTADGRNESDNVQSVKSIEASAVEREHSNSDTDRKRQNGTLSGVSSDVNDNPYNLAQTAGPLLVAAESKDATQQIKMDAFVIKFSDSIYQANGFNSKFPRYIETDEMIDLSRQLTKKYIDKMEAAFRTRFGSSGDSRRRALLLEGRFFCHLNTYHHNIYYKDKNTR